MGQDATIILRWIGNRIGNRTILARLRTRICRFDDAVDGFVDESSALALNSRPFPFLIDFSPLLCIVRFLFCLLLILL